jgi:hypothetical protein
MPPQVPLLSEEGWRASAGVVEGFFILQLHFDPLAGTE